MPGNQHDHRSEAALYVGANGARAVMRLSAPRKAAIPSDRRDVLRQARAAAPTLRVAYPRASLVRVELAFQETSRPEHTPQGFSIYPPAKAHFVYACPFGDCDGVYDLNAITLEALARGSGSARGTLICSGHRSRDGKLGCSCDLTASYSIAVCHDEAGSLPPAT